MRHFVIVGILVILTSILTYLGLSAIGLMPVEASAQAVPIDWLWNWEMVTISFLFSLIMVPLAYSLIVFRRKKGDMTDAEHMEGNYALEITWTIIPLMLVLVFAYLGSYSLGLTRRADPNAMIIKVKAQQWSWTFDYPDYGFTSNELHLPVNKQVVLQMESADVIHSFWVPEFRVKQDVVPGRVTEYRITPTLIGPYKVRCSEMCGTSHAYMEAPVIVNAQADFDSWVSAQKEAAAAASLTPEGHGQQLVLANGCRGCHTIDGSVLTGPSWLHMYGNPVELSNGTTVIADDAYLKESILDPKAKEVKGFAPTVMPPFKFTDQEIADIIAYLKTLK